MQGIDQAVYGGKCILFGAVSQMSVACGSGGAVVAEYRLNMTKAQALFKQMGGETVAQGVNRDFFLIPHWVTTAFMAVWAPPRSMCVVALRIRSGEPTAFGNSQQGLRCLHHKARNA